MARSSMDLKLTTRDSRRNGIGCVAAALAVAFLCCLTSRPIFAASGTWSSSTSGNWSDTTKWTGGVIADGAGSTGNFNTVNLNPGITVTIDTTSRTLGILNIGDTNRSDSYTLTSSGGATLTLNNSGVASQINF